jgi:flagellar hook-length control protein FliK
MTPQTVNLNLVNALQAQPGGKTQPAPASVDTPFSKVLSNEMEQKKPVSEPRQEPRPETRQARKAGAEPAAGDAAAPQDAAGAEAQQATAETAASEPSASAEDSSTPQPDAAPQDRGLAPALPDALLALAAVPAMLPPTAPPLLSAGGVGASADTLAAGAAVLPNLNTPAAPALTPAQLADAAADAAAATAAESAAQQPVKADFQAAMTATTAHASAAAAVLPGQIAAALSPDALKLDEARTDGFGNLSMAAAQSVQPGTLSATASTAGNALAPAVGSAAWSQALGEKIVWMAAGAQQSASLTLNPPNLGPLQVVINVNNDQATASFFAAQPEVRQALEAALPRLREMMSESGIQLGQATVSAEQQQQQFNEAANREARRTATAYPGSGGADDTTVPSLPAQIRQSGRGLVDTFA